MSVDGQSWKFELDCRQGTASIELDAQRFTLRVLSWRDKRLLARFAHLSESFLEDQFLRLCLIDIQAPPPSGPEREALIALARWLNAPGGDPGLPLDRHLLASVTLQVCQSIHATPQTFDGLDAADVESLWQAVRAGTPLETHSEAANRILVMPDATATRTNSLATPGSPSGPVTEPDHDVPAVSTPSPGSPSAPVIGPDHEVRAVSTPPGVSPLLPAADTRKPLSAGESAPAAESRSVEAGNDQDQPATRAAPAAPGQSRNHQPGENRQAPLRTGRFRMLLDARVGRSPRPPTAVEAAPHSSHNAPAAIPAESAAHPCTSTAVLDALRSQRDPTAWLWPPGMSELAHPSASALGPKNLGGAPYPELSPGTGDTSRSRAWPADTWPQPPANPDAVFEELAARLEQAAAEQGIDL